MTRRKGSAVLGIFSMPQELAAAAIDSLPPAQRDAITITQAGQIMQICVDAAKAIGNVLEPQRPQVLTRGDQERDGAQAARDLR